jgi:hypothetical protein
MGRGDHDRIGPGRGRGAQRAAAAYGSLACALGCGSGGGRHRHPLRHPRAPELSPRRGGDRGPRASGQLRSHAPRGEDQRVDAAALLHARLGVVEGLRPGPGRVALALGPVRGDDDSGRVSDRTGAGRKARRVDHRGAGRLKSDADLVFPGGEGVRAADPALRRLAALLPALPPQRRARRPGALVALLGAGPGQPLLRRLPARRRGSLASGRGPGAAAEPGDRRRWRDRGRRPRDGAADASPGELQPHRLDRPGTAPWPARRHGGHIHDRGDGEADRRARARWPGAAAGRAGALLPRGPDDQARRRAPRPAGAGRRSGIRDPGPRGRSGRPGLRHGPQPAARSRPASGRRCSRDGRPAPGGRSARRGAVRLLARLRDPRRHDARPAAPRLAGRRQRPRSGEDPPGGRHLGPGRGAARLLPS